jgi:hypothetical protein
MRRREGLGGARKEGRKEEDKERGREVFSNPSDLESN